nr:hypothetical protein [Saccharopolyspora endophytica]
MLGVKIAVQVKLVPTPEQASALEATLRAVNQAANEVSRAGFDAHGLKGSVKQLRSLRYADLKERGLGAQAAQHVIKRVADAYSTLRGAIRNGRLGRSGSKRRVKAESKPVEFRLDAAHTFDDWCLSWNYDRRTVSIWTMRGRMKNITFAASPHDLKTLGEHRRGEADLVFRDGKWFLIATCPHPRSGQRCEV